MATPRYLLASVLVLAVPFAARSEGEGGVPPSWREAIEDRVAEREYHLSWQETWHAPNRAQNLRTYFTERGVRLVPRTGPAEWELSLALARWGRPDAMQDVEPARLVAADNRIDYERTAIAEWYINDERGLEQLFRIDASPDSAGDTRSPVHLDLALEGNLSPIVASDRQSIDLATTAGVRVLRVAKLQVVDAAGRELPSLMDGFVDDSGRGIRLTFDDADVLYPVTVDPLITSPNWSVESNQASALLGSVATAGDVNGDGYSDVLVGASSFDNGQADEGRVFAYLGSASGLSTTPAWSVESNQASAGLGTVGTAGDVNGDGYSDVIVGANLYNNDQNDEGRAWVYHGSASGLSSTPAWVAEGNQVFPAFGSQVGTAGDVNGDGYSDVYVSAVFADGPAGFDEGAAYVYHGSPSGLSTSAAWISYGGIASLRYGLLGTAGDVNADGYSDVIAGANLYANGEVQEGRAYLYHGSASGLETSPSWTVEGNQNAANFGVAGGTAGDVNGDGYADVIVGAYNWDNPWTNEGAAFVYHGSATGLSTTHAWSAEGEQTSANFGLSVGTAGDWNGDGYADVVVGSLLYDNGQIDEGSVFLYLGSATGLRTTAEHTMESDQLQAQLGTGVGTAGDVNGDGFSDVIVGAMRYDNGQTDEGRAYVYYGSAGPPSVVAAWATEAQAANSSYGEGLASAGDVDGDGPADILVGAPGWDAGGTNAGAAFLFKGSVNGPVLVPTWSVIGDQVGAELGRSVDGVGDVNSDGYEDVLVGAPNYDGLATNGGRASLFYGSSTGLGAAPAWTVDGAQANARLGWSVAGAGDVNGDGFADALVGAIDHDNGETNEGRVWAYHGSPTGFGASASWIAESNQVSSGFGSSVSTAGDVNGDGYSDVLVGAFTFDNGHTDEGRAFVYHGSASGLFASPSWTGEVNQASAWFGIAVDTAGDVNGDGYSDVIIGAPFYDNGQSDEGGSFVYLGSPTGLAPGSAWTAESNQASARFGESVAAVGDVDGDGYADVVVGAPVYTNGQAAEGRAYLYRGSAAGLASTPSWMVESNQAAGNFGTVVAAAGDVNGDAYADLVVSAPWFDNGHTDEGRVSFFWGNGGPGFHAFPEQRRTSGSLSIARLGASDATDGFRMTMLAKTPFGRGNVRLETEVKPLGTPLDGTGTVVEPFEFDTGTTFTVLSKIATGLAGSTPHHWRMRLLYDPVAVPFAQHGRWLSPPWNGSGETDLRTADASAAGGVAGMTIARATGVQIALDWDPSCRSTDVDYEVYEGVLGDFTSHEPRYCTTAGATTKTLTPLVGNTYYLVVPTSEVREGSYGTTSEGVERPQGQGACLAQQLAVCE